MLRRNNILRRNRYGLPFHVSAKQSQRSFVCVSKRKNFDHTYHIHVTKRIQMSRKLLRLVGLLFNLFKITYQMCNLEILRLFWVRNIDFMFNRMFQHVNICLFYDSVYQIAHDLSKVAKNRNAKLFCIKLVAEVNLCSFAKCNK